MKSRLKTSTALIASLSLLTANPAHTQEAVTPDDGQDVTMICADGTELPCAEGVQMIPAPEEMIDGDAAEALEGAADAATEVIPEADVEAESAADPDAAAEPDAAPETEVAPESDAAADPEAAAETEPVPEAETAVESETTPEADADASTEPAAEPAAPDAEPAAEEPAADTATEPVIVPEAEVPAPDPEAAPADAADTTDAAGDTAAPEAAEAAPSAEAEMSDTQSEATPEAAETDAPDLPVQPDAASGEAPVAAAAAASDEPDEIQDDAEMSEEVVTEETARSSAEDFANPVGEAAAPAATAEESGLSDGEKAALVGLGALAVGALLSNNRKVELNSGDRVVLERSDGSYQIIKDDNALLRQPGSTVRTQTFDDGSTRTIVTREDGSQIVTIRDAEYRVLRRVHVAQDGTQTRLFDDTVAAEPVDVSTLPAPAPRPDLSASADEAALRAALARETGFDRRFSLAQIRDIQPVRALVPVIDLNAINFETGSAAIRPDQAQALSRLGNLMKAYIDENPSEVFLIEGHTDAVGSAVYNLALSDRRAESVALAMTEYFDVPPENMVVQGYGEAFLKVPTEEAERANRRASVRRITDLLRQARN